MVLAIDIGNSNIVLGGYEKKRLRFLARLTSDRQMEAEEYAVKLRAILDLHGVLAVPIEQVVLASVVPAVTQVMVRALGFLTKAVPHVFSLADAKDVQVVIDNPAELGTDILASAVAVRHTRPLPAVIIDMGTATKITALDEDGRLLGVAISPGLFVSLEALISNASQLQGIPLAAPPAAIGRNTANSIKSGVVLGNAAMLDGMIDRFAAEMGGGLATVIATGGAAGIVVPHCRNRVELCETLLLDGLLHAMAQ
ncbi:type III pantothenate kinase [Ruminococcaceae bacterium OttesenSCG-928-O06]|nr:type III pantothenate kinase [Ruminococcaceae bacterium OttesenSCG-928-O06]